ncbi:glycosyltransferase family 2 protein [Candidatus Collierbacteria bacterium]|nr:glycosyltransferase family 2 protein [Candidatus Collierbacteria bacterium]
MVKLSVIILARNVADEIIPALKSARFADEIIVVDTGSTDGTVSYAEKYADKIIKTNGHDFAKWRNEGTAEAEGDWLLYLDSDERITPQLAEEIKTILNSPKHQAYTLSRYEIMLGKHLPHWGDPRVLRLMQKSALIKWTGRLHEQPQIKGSIGKLHHQLVHLTHKNIDEKVLNTLNWSRLEAEMLFKANHPKMKGWRFFRIILTEFFYRFIKQGLWRDGTEGSIEIIYQMFSRFLTYVRLWQLQRQPSLSETYKQIDKKLIDQLKKEL